MDGGWEALDGEAYRALFFHSLDGVFFTDPTSGVILAANPAACALLGMTEAEICAVARDGIVDPDDRARWENGSPSGPGRGRSGGNCRSGGGMVRPSPPR